MTIFISPETKRFNINSLVNFGNKKTITLHTILVLSLQTQASL